MRDIVEARNLVQGVWYSVVSLVWHDNLNNSTFLWLFVKKKQQNKKSDTININKYSYNKQESDNKQEK